MREATPEDLQPFAVETEEFLNCLDLLGADSWPPALIEAIESNNSTTAEEVWKAFSEHWFARDALHNRRLLLREPYAWQISGAIFCNAHETLGRLVQKVAFMGQLGPTMEKVATFIANPGERKYTAAFKFAECDKSGGVVTTNRRSREQQAVLVSFAAFVLRKQSLPSGKLLKMRIDGNGLKQVASNAAAEQYRRLVNSCGLAGLP